jgi:hypothetical protein
MNENRAIYRKASSILRGIARLPFSGRYSGTNMTLRKQGAYLRQHAIAMPLLKHRGRAER